MNALLVKPVVRWFDQANNPPKCVSSAQLAYQLSADCRNILIEENSTYEKYKKECAKRNDFHWVDVVRKKGSLRDRAAALVLLLQDSLAHNLDCLDTLTQWVSPKGKREAFIAMDALVDLFVQYLLPPARKLIAFENRPLAGIDLSKRADKTTCLIWFIEGELKKKFMRFLENVEKLSYDKVESSKSKAIKTLFILLSEHPEQEQFLLSRLVNKFGDPSRKIAAKAAHLLSKLTTKHPAMKLTVLAEVESLLFRKNITQKAQYYALCYLSAIVLTYNEYDFAYKLIQVYLNVFKLCIQSGEADTKLMAVLLTGINRAHPFCATDRELVSREHEDVLFRLVYMATLPVAIQCLALLFQILDKKNLSFASRFYCALYKKLQDPLLATTHHQLMMFNLIYKAVRDDDDEVRVIAFIKRLLQLCLVHPSQVACSLLIVIGHILKDRPNLLLACPVTRNGSLSPEHIIPLKNDSNVDKQNQITAKVKHFYDPFIDNPLKSFAETTLPYELLMLSKHFHPGVAVFAKAILNRSDKVVNYDGDPLKDFTLAHFLDRFVYRNPKAQVVQAKDTVFGKSKTYQPHGVRNIPIGSAAYMGRNENAIPVDEAFLYRYFVQSGRRTDGTGNNNRQRQEDFEDLDSDEADEFLDDINNHVDINHTEFNGVSDDEDFYTGFKEGRVRGAKQHACADSSSEEDEGSEIEEAVDDAEDSNRSFDDESIEDREDYTENNYRVCDNQSLEGDDDFFKCIPTTSTKEKGKVKHVASQPCSIKKAKRLTTSLAESAEKLQEILESNRYAGYTDTSLALSAKTASGKMSDWKQLQWEQKRQFQLFGKRRTNRNAKYKKGKVTKKHAKPAPRASVIKLAVHKKNASVLNKKTSKN